jgi:hypothetical protein
VKIGWSDLNNVQEAGQCPFRDGVITVLELEIAIWRKHPKALFALMRKNPIRRGVGHVGLLNYRAKGSRTYDGS